MILGQVAYVDCVAFLIFLLPQLLLRLTFFELVTVAVKALPFLRMSNLVGIQPSVYPHRSINAFPVAQLPYQFLKERFLVKKCKRSPFVQQATAFEDFIIRIIRYAFARIPANIGIIHTAKVKGSNRTN